VMTHDQTKIQEESPAQRSPVWVCVLVTVFFLSKIRDGADREQYEQWVKEVDYPACQRFFKSIKSYTAFRVRDLTKNSPYDYIEHIDLTSREDYEKDMEKPEFKKLISEWSRYIESAIVAYADPI
jgi:hypothetical protein